MPSDHPFQWTLFIFYSDIFTSVSMFLLGYVQDLLLNAINIVPCQKNLNTFINLNLPGVVSSISYG